MPLSEIVQRAADAAGGPSKLAKQLLIKPEALYGWKRVPTNRVLAISRATGIPAHELAPDRPELFPVPEEGVHA